MDQQLTLRTEVMRDLLFSKPDPSLNIGPGYAKLEHLLEESRVKLLLDKNPKRLRLYRDVENAHNVNAVAEFMPYRSECIPTITTQSTFQILDDQTLFLHELKRVLSEGGFYCITIEWHTFYQWGKQAFPVNKLDVLKDYLNMLGLSVDEVRHLSHDGYWHDRLEQGFSVWISGHKQNRKV